jgi:hypothetical protein
LRDEDSVATTRTNEGFHDFSELRACSLRDLRELRGLTNFVIFVNFVA